MDAYREMCERIYVDLNKSKEEIESLKLELAKSKEWGYQLADKIQLMNFESKEAKFLIKELVNSLNQIGLYSDLGGKLAGEVLDKNREVIERFI